MHLALGILLLLHGVVHVVGFIGAFQLIRGLPYQTSLLGEQLNPDALCAKLLGMLWLFTAVAFVVAAAALLIDAPWWAAYTAAVTAFSLLLCMLGWPGSKIGVPINLTVLVALVGLTQHNLGSFLLGWLRILP